MVRREAKEENHRVNNIQEKTLQILEIVTKRALHAEKPKPMLLRTVSYRENTSEMAGNEMENRTNRVKATIRRNFLQTHSIVSLVTDVLGFRRTKPYSKKGRIGVDGKRICEERGGENFGRYVQRSRVARVVYSRPLQCTTKDGDFDGIVIKRGGEGKKGKKSSLSISVC